MSGGDKALVVMICVAIAAVLIGKVSGDLKEAHVVDACSNTCDEGFKFERNTCTCLESKP